MIQSVPKTHSLSDFAENVEELSAEIKQSGQPLSLTVDGAEEFVLLDAASYHKLLEEVDRAEAIAGIQR
jgi:PHD/YefM family antitoxin component YafN of YafNO toxin-antitoxin module